jgi:hypothetical protein
MDRGTLSRVAEGIQGQVEADLIEKGCKAVKKAPGGQVKCDKVSFLERSKNPIAILAQNVPNTSCRMYTLRCLSLPY